MIPIVYHPRSNITAFGLERYHPFDGRKYGRIHIALIDRGLRRPGDFLTPKQATRRQLLAVHGRPYLDSLRVSKTLARILEVPVVGRLPGWLVDWRILRPMRIASGGTILACRLALDHRIAINLGGGYHHASANWGGGFCAYADAPLAVQVLHAEGKIRKVLVVDLDAHQGNGTADAFRAWPWASIFDIYQDDLFPARKEPEDFAIPIRAGLAGFDYLTILQDALPAALDAARPDLIIYNAGSDPYAGDPLTGLRLSIDDLVERDLMVVSMACERTIPLAMVLSGGYAAESWRIHAESIEAILTRFDRES